MRSNPFQHSETPSNGDAKGGKIVSEVVRGNFSAVEVPDIVIPGSAPLVYKLPEELLDEIWNSDEFAVNDLEEEFLMFPGEILDKAVRK